MVSTTYTLYPGIKLQVEDQLQQMAAEYHRCSLKWLVLSQQSTNINISTQNRVLALFANSTYNFKIQIQENIFQNLVMLLWIQ